MYRRSLITVQLVVAAAAVGCGARTDLTISSGGPGDGGRGTGGGGGSAPVVTNAEVSAKWEHACAVDAMGQLSCWGNNAAGEIGVAGAPLFVPSPLTVDPGHTYLKVSAGVMTTCAIRTDHTLWCFGRNEGGPLATGDRAPHSTPVEIGTDGDWTDVDVGSGMACGLRRGDQLYCWGGRDYGAAPSNKPLGPKVLKSPTLIEGRYTAIASHWYSTMVIRDDGTLWITKNDGKFSQVEGFDPHASHVSVGPLNAMVIGTKGNLYRLSIVSDDDVVAEPEPSSVVFGGPVASSYSSCAISADGAMYCGGDHPDAPLHFAALGDDYHDWTTVGVGNGFGCGTRAAGAIWCWGTLSSELGGPSTVYGALPKPVE